MAKQFIIDDLLAGEVIVNIGQIDEATRSALDKMVRDGTVTKWRGFWFPIAGASHGIGPLKTCWGLASKFAPEAE